MPDRIGLAYSRRRAHRLIVGGWAAVTQGIVWLLLHAVAHQYSAMTLTKLIGLFAGVCRRPPRVGLFLFKACLGRSSLGTIWNITSSTSHLPPGEIIAHR